MSSRQDPTHARLPGDPQLDPMNAQMLAFGRLHFLSAFCPLHQQFPSAALARLFVPAVNTQTVRFFQNDQGQVCAALIWARLSDEVSHRMIFEQTPPTADEWLSGHNLWFLDILAPFDHGKVVARHIARNPPEEPFYFARLGEDGLVRKVVRGDAGARRSRVTSFFIDPETGETV